MIPPADTLAEGATFLARRFGISTPPRADLIAAAVEEAKALATGAQDEPAALFYALSRRTRAFPGVHSRVVTLLTFNQALLIGYRLRAEERELWSFFPKHGQAPTFHEVKAWFEARLEPL